MIFEVCESKRDEFLLLSSVYLNGCPQNRTELIRFEIYVKAEGPNET